ncbi:MAG: helix-turn-helix domain-containing protein [Liquorilactobacillus sp.]|uniref:helix-turn-helix domain-containing protein n=1 Tax=Liquorilactobacillus nagelii TaxID=82688 RepID=UPI0039E7B4A8
MNALPNKLREARQANGFSQNEIATVLHISRQSISKWENGRGYPDLDNLIALSDLYKISIDELLKENEQLKQKIDKNNTEIEEKQKKLNPINTELYQNKDEGLLLFIVTVISALIPLLGLIVPIYILWRNNKYNSLYKTIITASILVIMISAYNIYAFSVENWFIPSQTTVVKVK